MFARPTFSRIPRVAARCCYDSLRAKRVPLSFSIIIISYIFIFVNMGNYMRALAAYFASEAS